MAFPTQGSTEPVSVLVVDDDADVRELLSQFLEIEGFRVVGASNGREAIERLREDSRASVILLDLMMPVMNGWQFRVEQKQDPAVAGIPVVVISVVRPDHVAPIDANAYVPKPIDLDSLLTTVRVCCGLNHY
jgi:CheY-like chemotaxis protein